MGKEFVDEMPANVTNYLENSRDTAISKILDSLDLVDMENGKRKQLRKIILQETNRMYTDFCRVLTYVQEQDDKS